MVYKYFEIILYKPSIQKRFIGQNHVSYVAFEKALERANRDLTTKEIADLRPRYLVLHQKLKKITRRTSSVVETVGTVEIEIKRIIS